MKKTKFNPELLKEELKRFKLLNEYDFYQEKKESPEYKDLIAGGIEEADEMPDDAKVDDAADAVGDELGVDATETDGAEETSGEITDDEPTDGGFGDAEGDATDAEPAEAPLPEPEPANNDVEVDVTSLVKGSEEAKVAADKASHNTEMLMQKLTSLEAHVANMDRIGAKIEDLEKEIIKRNPTPVEKLEMRSLDSYPFNQKLSDYWSDKEGAYDVMGNEKKKKEYILTKDDIDSSYSDMNVKKSFGDKPADFEEEDINDYTEENY